MTKFLIWPGEGPLEPGRGNRLAADNAPDASKASKDTLYTILVVRWAMLPLVLVQSSYRSHCTALRRPGAVRQ